MSTTSTMTRTRTFDGGPRDGQTEPLDVAREYLLPDGRTPVREKDITWDMTGITGYADVYGKECGSPRGAREVRYIWCGRTTSTGSRRTLCAGS